MAEIRRISYVSWDEFARSLRQELFRDDPFRPGCYLFRGLANQDYELTSSFDRLFPSHPQRQVLFSKLLEYFRDECEGSVAEEILFDEVKTLALGQHYGLPTRLLDWTESPYVAAFFAMNRALLPRPPSGQFASVWALHQDAPIWTADLGVDVLKVPSIGNVRIRNQAGRFTLSRTPFPTLEAYVENCAYDGVALTQMSFPAHDAGHALAQLSMMGLTPARLFPDLIGAAAAAKMRVLLADVHSDSDAAK